MKKAIKITAVGLIIFALIANIQSSIFSFYGFKDNELHAAVWSQANSTSTGGSSSGSGSSTSGIFEAEHPGTVQCPASIWFKSEYFTAGYKVGVTFIENGIIKTDYHGSYSYHIDTHGGVDAHQGTTMVCYGWGWGCTPISATQACQ